MFIELTEILRCPNDHDESYVVCVPVVMEGRQVLRGGIGCPSCGAEYPIVDGVVHFGRVDTDAPSGPVPFDASALQAFINLEGRGGYALLAGRLARLGREVAALVPGVHFFAVNPPPDVTPDASLSLLHSPQRLPVKTSSVRAVVLGAGCATEPWLGDGARVLLRGLRFVAENEGAQPRDIAELARGGGLFVGEKR